MGDQEVGGTQMTDEEIAEEARQRAAAQEEADRQLAALQRDGYVELGLCYYYARNQDGNNRLDFEETAGLPKT